MGLARVSTGTPGLDQVLDGLRLGDNVVWQVETIDDYRHYVMPFVEQAQAEQKRLVYLRFGHHEAILRPDAGIQIYELEPSLGFEHFSTEIRTIAKTEGEGVYYIFDCLSELLYEWSTDLMIGNFFLLTCPYLFELKTIAFFALLRGRHTHQTVARIRETTQLLLDVYHHDRYYVHPLKVWKRYSPTMFLPHEEHSAEEMVPLTNSADAALLFASQFHLGMGTTERRLDYWERIFLRVAELAQEKRQGDHTHAAEAGALEEKILRMLIGRDERILALARKYLTLDDLLLVKSRLIGSGFIGGKAVGLLLARAILAADTRQDWRHVLEPHDSFYVGSDVYYTYLVENNCWQLRQLQKREDGYFIAARALQEKIANGSFPEGIRDQFLELLAYFGQAPIIVRSSSLLEDGFGNAFAGKYESVFCANQGDLAERYEQFIQAVKRVYASTMNDEALAYRWQRGLAESDEQMALLVQRVSGSPHGAHFFPDLAGVALSHNLYVWREEMNPQAGMLRLVLGLGTRAVDRTDNDYARFVALDHPALIPPGCAEGEMAYSQQKLDMIDLAGNSLGTADFQELATAGEIGHLPLVATQVNVGREGQTEKRWRLDFRQLLQKRTFPATMREMLAALAAAYGYPVDVEFAANISEKNGIRINLLQCRPLQVRSNQGRVEIPAAISAEKLLFRAGGKFMGGALDLRLAAVCLIVPAAYAALTQNEKYQVARLIGRLNQELTPADDKISILIGPGRWGTSTPSLGVPASFAEINKFTLLVEMAFEASGFVPELSYGTHFFQDLVESGLSYLALDERDTGTYFNHGYFAAAPNALAVRLPEAERWREVVRFIDGEALLPERIHLSADPAQQKIVCWLRDADA